MAAAAPADDRPSWRIHHPSLGDLARCAQASQIVKPDGGVGSDQVDVGVEVAQQPVGQAIGQGAKLFLGVLDHRPQRRLAGHHLRPTQPTDVQRHRVLGGEPADGVRQVDIGSDVLVAAVALHVDADRRAGAPKNSVTANPKAINKMSCTPA